MFRRFVLICAVAVFATSLPARTKPAPPLDPDYVSALATANAFLHAWQSHDEEAGILLLSDDLRQHSSADAVSIFFSSHPQQTYEIARGHKLSPGRYQFPITLWQISSANAIAPHPKSHATTLIVVCTPKNDWLVDNLP